MMAIKNVTNTECEKRHSRLWLAFKAGSVILGLLATVTCFAFTFSYNAGTVASEAKSAAEKNKTEMTTSFSFIREGLDRIDRKLDKMNGKP